MAQTSFTFSYYVAGVPTDPTSIKLSDSAGTFGVKRSDNDAVVVAVDTAMERISAGTYQYFFYAPVADIPYVYAIEYVYNNVTYNYVGAVIGEPASADSGDTLLEVRQLFIELSGREDLAISGSIDYDTDRGADRYINAGQRMLDRMIDNPDSKRLYNTTIVAGDYTVVVSDLRSIEKFYLVGSDGELIKLEERDLDFLITKYPKWEETPQNIPVYYHRYLDSGQGTTQTIVLMPPANGTFTVRIIGKFYNPWLVDNADRTYWTRMDPMTLTHAALYKLEVGYRNSEGASDWMKAINVDLAGIDKDMADDEMPQDPII